MLQNVLSNENQPLRSYAPCGGHDKKQFLWIFRLVLMHWKKVYTASLNVQTQAIFKDIDDIWLKDTKFFYMTESPAFVI